MRTLLFVTLVVTVVLEVACGHEGCKVAALALECEAAHVVTFHFGCAQDADHVMSHCLAQFFLRGDAQMRQAVRSKRRNSHALEPSANWNVQGTNPTRSVQSLQFHRAGQRRGTAGLALVRDARNK